MSKFKLSTAMREQLEHYIVKPDNPKLLKRAQALVWVDDGELVRKVATRLHVSRQSVHNWIHRFEELSAPIAVRLGDAPRSGRPREKRELLDQVVPDLLKQRPQAFGYRATGWTNGLLCTYILEHHHVQVSRFSMEGAIERAGYRWKRPRYVPARGSPTWRQAKGGSSEA